MGFFKKISRKVKDRVDIWKIDASLIAGMWREKKKLIISSSRGEEEVKLADISATGMRFFIPQSLGLGSIIYSKFKILPNLFHFFIRGKVVRIQKKEGDWEVAVEFEKVSTIHWQDGSLVGK